MMRTTRLSLDAALLTSFTDGFKLTIRYIYGVRSYRSLALAASWALFASLEGKGREGFGGLIFLHNTITKLSSFEGTQKLYWRRGLGGFGGFV